MGRNYNQALFTDPIIGSNIIGEPWSILPSQLDKSRDLTPTQRLLEEVLHQALRDLQYSCSNAVDDGHFPSNKAQLKQEILDWCFNDDATGSISFDHICNALQLNKRSIRRLVARVLNAWEQSRGKHPAFKHAISNFDSYVVYPTTTKRRRKNG